MSRQIFQMRVDDKTNTAIDYLKAVYRRQFNLKIKDFIMKLYEFEQKKQELNNIV